jgi:hypothetical protein
VNGTLTYQDRNGSTQNGRHTSVALYEHDPGGTDDLLAVTSTNGNGYYSFPPILNWDYDGDPTNRNLDLYVVFEAMHYDIGNTYHRVKDINNIGLSGETYTWNTSVSSNVSSIVIPKNLNIAPSTVNFVNTYRAMWIMQDLRRAWQYTYNQSVPYYINPGSVSAVWEHNVEEFLGTENSFYFQPPLNIVFIKDEHVVSQDTVVHEAGHNYMYNMTGWVDGGCPSPHDIKVSYNVNCAWSEGWGHFLAIVANLSLDPSGTDVCYDFLNGHCVTGITNFETLTNASSGDAVEGRVASALLDLYDNNNDGTDTYSFGFDEIARVVLQGYPEYEFQDFWSHWKENGFDKHNAIRSIDQNTMNYNNPPTLSLPDWNVPHDSSWPNAFSLLNPVYVSDIESSPSQITSWQITSASSPNCGVSIDAQKNIDIAPITNWIGSCTFTISASDTLAYGNDVFTVYVTQASFADVPTSHLMYSQIESMLSNGITGGCGSNPRIYCPDNIVDRGQMAVFLLRGMYGGSYVPPSATGTMFTDVPVNHQFASWIEQLANEGITSGCGGGNYCPSNSVTRAQMAIFLLRAKHGSSYIPPTATGTMFADVPANAFAASWIEQLANEGITSGCGGGNFCPNNSVTRAQMAVFLVNTFNLP